MLNILTGVLLQNAWLDGRLGTPLLLNTGIIQNADRGDLFGAAFLLGGVWLLVGVAPFFNMQDDKISVRDSAAFPSRAR